MNVTTNHSKEDCYAEGGGGEHEEQGCDILQSLLKEIDNMKAVIEEQVAQNENKITELQKDAARKEEEIVVIKEEIGNSREEMARNHHNLKTELSSLQKRAMMLECSGRNDQTDDDEELQRGGSDVFSRVRVEHNCQSPPDGDEFDRLVNSSDWDQTTLPSSSSEPFAFWSKGSLTLLSLSYAFRTLFAICYYFISIDTKLAIKGTSDTYRTMTKPLCSTFLLSSVIFLLPTQLSLIRNILYQGYQHRKREMVGVVGWLVILAGAIAFVTARDDFYSNIECDKVNGSSCLLLINPNLRLAFLLLIAGHVLELIHKFLHALQLNAATRSNKIVHILLVISPSCLAIAAYVVPVELGVTSKWSVFKFRIGLQALLLFLHALVQYVTLFRITAQTSKNQNTDEEDEQQSIIKPEPIPDNMLDTYAFMIASNDAKAWNFGLLVFFIQAGLSTMIFVDQMLLVKKTEIPFDAPFLVRPLVSVAQFMALVLSILWQTDILTSVQMLGMLWYGRNGSWPYEEIHAKDGNFLIWMDKVLLPNVLRFIEGVLVLSTSFIIIVKSDDVIDLFKDFTGRKVRWNASNVLKSSRCFVIKIFLTDVVFSLSCQIISGRKPSS